MLILLKGEWIFPVNVFYNSHLASDQIPQNNPFIISKFIMGVDFFSPLKGFGVVGIKLPFENAVQINKQRDGIHKMITICGIIFTLL